MKRRHLLGTATASAGLAVLSSSVRAQAFPDRPIRFVVPYAPGGATDTSARLAADFLSGKLGQQVLVDNKPGGGTIIGTEIVAKAKPDGYTILLAPGTIATNTSFGLKLPYDPTKDLAPIIGFVDMPLLLATNKEAPFKTMAELIAYAKQQPAPISYASPGNASIPHLWGEQFKSEVGIKLEHIGYKGSADALKDVLGGHVMLFSDTLLPTGLAVKDGRLVATAPATIAGKIEVRGHGIINLPFRASVAVGLVVDLMPEKDIERMPETTTCVLDGVTLPRLVVDAFSPSATAKVRLVMGSK